jgi:Xaa-Pro aminopeptidase
MTTRTECAANIKRLQEKLCEQQLEGALITHPIDLYYFSGTRQNGVLWIPAQSEAKLMIRKSLSRARKEAAIEQIEAFPSSKNFAAALPAGTEKIGMTFDVLPVQQHNFYTKLLPNVQTVDISSVNRDLRSIKSDHEIDIMRRGGEHLCSIFAQVPEFLREGVREVDVSAEFEMRLRKAGGEGYVRMRAFNQELFQGLAVSGDHGCTPGFFDGAVTGSGMSKASPHGASVKLVERNEPILIDYTGVFEGYILDMTRMFVVGHLNSELQAAFDTSLVIQKAVAEAMTPGANCAEIFELAKGIAEDAGLGDRFMGPPGEQAKFVGHGVGLELDEMPVLAKGFDVPLQLNQTIAVEPKFVFPGSGVVGIENTFMVGKNGGERLTSLSDELITL